MPLVCTLPDCPVAVTGKCLKSHSPVESCPHLAPDQPVGNPVTPAEQPTTNATRIVYPGNELGLDQAAEIMSARYTHLIGLLGESDTGKTCMLCSLYLLASCGQLAPEHRFAGSVTLVGYESRLRNYRKWPGPLLPERITPHTELAHPRVPGFLHLALSAVPRAPRVYEMLFTDLPGEWTSGLLFELTNSVIRKHDIHNTSPPASFFRDFATPLSYPRVRRS
jgi:Double-GTPase 2